MTDSKNDQVVVEREIVIAASQRVVFDFVADYRNDPQWRAEVERMDVPRPYEIGVPFTGRAFRSVTGMTPGAYRQLSLSGS